MFGWLADRFWRWKHGRDLRRGGPWERAPRARGLHPAYADWVGGFAVDPSGGVWFSPEPHAWADAAPVAEPAVRHAVLAVAVRRHPELTHVAPLRSAADPDCPTCGGRGAPAQLPARFRYWIVCECGGLGWVPAKATPGPHVA